MEDFLLSAWRVALPVFGVILVGLAVFRTRAIRELAEATERDQGRFWFGLPWEVRLRYRRKLLVISWAFVAIIITTLAYSVWLHWHHLNFG